MPNPKHDLLPGMYVTLRITLGEQSHVYLIPQQGVQRDTVGAYVLVVGPDGKVLRKDVTTSESDGNDWIVTSGLENGDRVIVAGLQGAKEGGAGQRGSLAAAVTLGEPGRNRRPQRLEWRIAPRSP